MSRPSRICSVIDCGRVHFALGYCERHYRAERRKKRVSKDLAPVSGSAITAETVARNVITPDAISAGVIDANRIQAGSS